ncbi:MAG: hypothetical protein Hens3KO_01610 [Henriciella sp.]
MGMSELADQNKTMLPDADIVELTDRPSDAFNEVVMQADYTTRAALSFYRFRQLGGDHVVQNEKWKIHRKKRKAEKRREKHANTPNSTSIESVDTEVEPERTRKLRKGESTGRGVHYVSSHPKVPYLNISLIALMIIFESAANAYFFAKQSEFGLAGGIFQAAAVSLANVAVSFFIIGYWGLRHISMPTDLKHPYSRRNLYIGMGIIAIILGGFLVLVVNLSAAHYRNILDILAVSKEFPENLPTMVDPHFWVDSKVCQSILGPNSEIGATIGSAATNAMCRPFALHSLDAVVLFALGIAISAFAAFEGRRLDSPFPGFSDAARGLERARADLQDALYDFEDSYEDIKDLILEVKYGPEGMEDKDLTPHEKIIIHRTMKNMVAPYRKLIQTTEDILSDEFGLDNEIVKMLHVPAKDTQ